MVFKKKRWFRILLVKRISFIKGVRVPAEVKRFFLIFIFGIGLARIFHKKRSIFFTNCYDTVYYNIKYGENAMTKCTQSDFGFPACKSRKIALDFLGGNLTLEAGGCKADRM